MSEIKKIRITLRAFTAVEYTEVLEVPSSLQPSQLMGLVERRYEEVDAYRHDPDYWERGDAMFEPVDDQDPADFKVSIQDGSFVVIPAAPSAPAPNAGEPSEDDIANFLQQQIESGELAPHDIARRLARFGLMQPSAFVAEMQERIEMAEDQCLEAP